MPIIQLDRYVAGFKDIVFRSHTAAVTQYCISNPNSFSTDFAGRFTFFDLNDQMSLFIDDIILSSLLKLLMFKIVSNSPTFRVHFGAIDLIH